MLKVGDILWTFRENDYFVGEISEISVVFNTDENLYYFINTNGIIGKDRALFIPITEDLNTLVKIQYYSEIVYHTISESVATNYIREHFNETDNQRDI